jgi:chromosome segregation ATPase
MSDEIITTSFFGRIGSFIRRALRETDGSSSSSPPVMALLDGPSDESAETAEVVEPAETGGEPRTTFLRPWVKRDQAIDQLQNGMAALSDLMGTIRQTMEKNSSRQDELMNYLSHLPQALAALPETHRVQGEALRAIQISIEQQDRALSSLPECNRIQSEALKAVQTSIEQQNRALGALPESNRMQGEALRAIQTGIEQQNTQQNKLANVLERMDRGGDETVRTLEVVRERVDGISTQEQAIGQSLETVGVALQTVSATAHSSAQVLENLNENIVGRDNQLERVLRRQNTRFTTMLAVAIVMSMAALTAVVVFGYLGYEALSHMGK